MYDDAQTGGHRELWIASTALPPSNGPEADAQMWGEAEDYLDYLCNQNERRENQAVQTALVDTYNRCVEERRRAEELADLHDVWAARRIGGVVEPPSVVRPPGPPTPGAVNAVLSDARRMLEQIGPGAVGGDEAYFDAARKISEAGSIVVKHT